MALPPTDWAKMRYNSLVIFTISALLSSTIANELTTSGKQKRQLFRENLLPSQGGKIPDSAFDPRRLSLNKLNQIGLFSPDGLVIQQRLPDRHHIPKVHPASTIKLQVEDDERYVAPPGRGYSSRYIDTTYIIRKPVPIGYVLVPKIIYYKHLPLTPKTSLKLQQDYHHHTNYIPTTKGLSYEEISQILAEFTPYLRKIHENE